MAVLVRHYLGVEPHQDLERFLEQYAEALWMEERLGTLLSGSIAKALNGK